MTIAIAALCLLAYVAVAGALAALIGYVDGIARWRRFDILIFVSLAWPAMAIVIVPHSMYTLARFHGELRREDRLTGRDRR